MSHALTLFFSATFGSCMGFVSFVLIQKIDLRTKISVKKIVLLGGCTGLIFSELIIRRFSALDLRLCFALLFAALFVQSVVDFYTHRLVRQITHAVALSGVVLLGFSSFQNSLVSAFVAACVCAVFGAIFSVVINKFSNGSLGIGDVRLIPVLGLHIGFLSYDTALWALFIASVLASVFGAILILVGRGSWKKRIAFGPFLALGAVIAIFSNEMLPRLLIA